MKKISLVSLIIYIFFNSTPHIFSQYTLEQDSIRTGSTYRFVLYNDIEVIGRVTSQDSVYLRIAGADGIYRLKKEDIFIVSKNLKRDYFTTILSLGGGVSFLNSETNHYGSNDYKGQYAFQLSALFPLGENKGLRADAGYSKWKRDEYVRYETYNNGYYKDGAQTKEYYSLKGEFVYGMISPKDKFWIYGTAGIGIHYLLDGAYDNSSGYYSNYDSAYHEYSYHVKEQGNVSAVLSIGSALGYRFTDKFGIYVDAQFNVVTYYGFFLFFWGAQSYIPLRAGITYTIY